MFGVDHARQEAVGLTFILSHLLPDSPYGAAEVKKMQFFGRDGHAKARTCFDNIEKVIEINRSDPDLLKKVRNELLELRNIRGTVGKCATEPLSQVELFELKRFLLTYEKLSSAYNTFPKNSRLEGITLGVMTGALDILDPEGKRIAAFAFESSALNAVRRKKQDVEAMLNKETSSGALDILTIKRRNLVIRESEEESRVAEVLSLKLREYLSAFKANMDAIAVLDLTIAKANLSILFGATRPFVDNCTGIVLDEMFNPYVEKALADKGQAMTRVSLTLSRGMSIITGANMGGKSVAVKTAVLNVLMCQIGLFVFAKHAEIPLFDSLSLTAEDLQDVSRGLSSFGAEIFKLNQIVEQMKSEFMFVAFDEFARGTNPEEGAAILRAVATYLSETDSICLMTTHYDGVVLPNFKHYQVSGLKLPDEDIGAIGDISSLSSYMDYNLVEVGTDTPAPRDALKICEILGLDHGVLGKIKNEYGGYGYE